MPQYDLRDYINTQQQQTFRSFIIHAPAMSHKSTLARDIQQKLGAALFDLQAHFVAHPKLAAHINGFTPHDLETLLLAIDNPQNLVVVDNMDFLLLTWTRQKKLEFVAMADLRLKVGLTNKTFIFMIQTDPVIVNHQRIPKNTHGQPRILPLDAFFAI